MTLRRRLVAVMVALVTVGLAVFGLVSYSLYSHSQYQRVDSQLQSVTPVLGRLVTSTPSGVSGGVNDANAPADGRLGGPNDRGTPLPPGSYVELRSPTGHVLAGRSIACYGTCPKPVLPASLAGGGPNGRLLTVPSTDGSSFRVLVRPFDPGGGPPGGDGARPDAPSSAGTTAAASAAGDVVVAAEPLGDVTRALHRLIIVDLAAGAAVLLALSAAGLLVVRRGLRPLERMSATARAIAGGDLSRRASPADGRGEVGQLGAAFNTMMGNIEKAFSERDATEGRLRQFLADASHELRTPLTSIRGYAELYRMGAAGSQEELDRVMDRIETHAKEMGGLVEELLMLARMDETRLPDRVEIDLSVVAAECCNDLAVTDRARRLTFDAPGPVPVVGDSAHLRQAVGNLLTNARRHTPSATPIEVAVTQDGGVAVLTVRDHGPGLPPDGLAHAFDRFWRADTSRRGNGAGLGLAIVAAVAAEHGGMADVANTADGGAIFTIRLPAPAWSSTAVADGAVGRACPVPKLGPGTESQAGPMPSPGDSEEPSAH
ncbi:MAG: sensor histidine kinase [Acidimicrobiales bacterium]